MSKSRLWKHWSPHQYGHVQTDNSTAWKSIASSFSLMKPLLWGYQNCSKKKKKVFSSGKKTFFFCNVMSSGQALLWAIKYVPGRLIPCALLMQCCLWSEHQMRRIYGRQRKEWKTKHSCCFLVMLERTDFVPLFFTVKGKEVLLHLTIQQQP